MGTGKVELLEIEYPKLALGDRKCEHGVILKIIATNICGSDQHMVRGRTTAEKGLVLGHEITGEVIELGRDVEFIKKGDIVSVPLMLPVAAVKIVKRFDRYLFKCKWRSCRRSLRICGYGWLIGGQAEYVMVPYADFNLLKFLTKSKPWKRY
jgi:glutathione-independent formaldehyde dehydrogenase